MNKKLLTTLLVGGLATTSASAESGEIVIQGSMPGTWELTVYDINSGYDFDLSCQDDACDGSGGQVTARVGTIHVQNNERTTAFGMLIVESLNDGRMINSSSLPGIADSNLDYTVTLVANALAQEDGATVTSTAASDNIASDIDVTTPTAFSLLTPKQLLFDGGTSGTFDVIVTLPDASDATTGQFPNAAGVYTDTIVFTIMDDDNT